MSKMTLAINSTLYKQATLRAEALGITLPLLVERHLRQLIIHRSDLKNKANYIRKKSKENMIIIFNQYAQRLIKKHA